MNVGRAIEESGFALRRGALAADQLTTLRALFESTSDRAGVRTRRGGMYAARNVLWDLPGIGETLSRLGLDQIATEALGGKAFPINATYFDKTADANWIVPGHQDLMMPVEREVSEPGFSGWRTKLGVVYVEPPAEVLSKLIALRVHLDDCAAANGALAVAPGTHRNGKLRDAEVTAIPLDYFTICEAAAGDILLMKPLLVHRSSPAASPSHRRVLHIVYAGHQPGANLRWKPAA